MRTCSRKWLGATLLAAATAVGIALLLSGVPAFHIVHHGSPPPEGEEASWFEVEAILPSWQYVVLAAVGGAGLLLLLLPGRPEKEVGRS